MTGSPGGPIRLNEWKEIAAHLGKSVRTLQRWEKTNGLPIHRIRTGEGGEIVYALVNEIEEWLRRRDKTKATNSLVQPPAHLNPATAANQSEHSRASSWFLVFLIRSGRPPSWCSPDFAFTRAEHGDDYADAHRQLERLRYLDHEFSDVDRNELWPVLRWKDGGYVEEWGPAPRTIHGSR